MSAILSECGTYRYRLDRAVDPLIGTGRVLVCMLNPSKADAENDDPTVRKLRGFCARMDPVPVGFTVVNAFAFRATDPRDLLRAYREADHRGIVVGAGNDEHIAYAASDTSRVIVAWGGMHKSLRWRIPELIGLLGDDVWCWGTTADGMPRHPLMLSYETPLVPWAGAA